MSTQTSANILLISSIFGVVYSTSYGHRTGNGTDACIVDYPFVASITALMQPICTGIIINKNTILTVAHCVYGHPATYYRVRVGSSVLRGGQRIKAARIISHEQYDNDSLDYDISLIKLVKHIKFGAMVAKAKLPKPHSDVSADVMAVIVGWKSLIVSIYFNDIELMEMYSEFLNCEHENGQASKQLQRAEVPVVHREICHKRYISRGAVTQRQICAGKLGVEACIGNTGGPLIVNGEIVGLFSWGGGCGTPTTVYTRVSFYIRWIKQNV